MAGSGTTLGTWPDVEELKQVLDVTSDDWEVTLERVLESAIKRVKLDVGLWDEDIDEPDYNLAQAALRMGELLALRPEAAAQAASDPTYQRLLYGHRRRFGIA
jgi:hypothetical protein